MSQAHVFRKESLSHEDAMAQLKTAWLHLESEQSSSQALLNLLAEYFGFSRLALFIKEEDGVFRCRARFGIEGDVRYALETQMTWPEEASHGLAVIFPERGWAAAQVGHIGMTVALPLLSHKQCFGRLIVGFEQPRYFDEENLRNLEHLARDVGLMLELSQLRQEARKGLEEQTRVLDALSEGVVIFNSQGQLVFVNHEAARMAGYASASALMGLSLKQSMQQVEITDLEGRPIAESDTALSRALCGHWTEAVYQMRPHGTTHRRVVRVKSSPVFDASGRVDHVVNSLCDVTEEMGWLQSFRALQEKTEARNERLLTHQRMTSAMHSAVSTEELLAVAVSECAEGFSSSMSAILFVPSQPTGLQVRSAHQLTEAWSQTLADETMANRLRKSFESASPQVLRDEKFGSKVLTCLPFGVKERRVGLLVLGFDEGKHFRRLDYSLLAAIAEQLGRSWERCELFESERKARDDAQASQARSSFLLEISALLGRDRENLQSLREVTRYAAEFFQGFCEIILLNELDEWASFACAHTAAGASGSMLDFARGQKPSGAWVQAQLGQSVTVEDAAHDEGLRHLGVASLMLAPLRMGDRVFGVLGVGSLARRSWEQPEQLLMSQLADRLSVAIEHAHLYQQLHTSLRARDHLLAILSHDMRGPIGVMQMKAQQLRRRLPAHSTSSGFVDSILKASWRTSDMIRDLLDVAALQSQEMSLRYSQVSIRSLLFTPLSRLSLMGWEGRVEAEVAPEVAETLVSCDPTWVPRVFAQLFESLLRKIPSDATASLTAQKAEEMAVFTLRVPGFTLSSQGLAQLFGQYWKAGPEVNSIGLGLYIAREVVQAHHGELTVESFAKEGLVVTFSLPLAMN